MAETITLDPSAVAGSRTQIDISAFIKEEGANWGDSDIETALADQAVGSSPVDYRLPNRHIVIPLSLRQVGGTAFATIRTQLQQKAALFQREGGWLMRQVDSTPLYADVVSATLHLGGSWLQAYRSTDIDAVLTLECVPDWYGAEVTLDTLTGTGSIVGKLKQSAADAVIAGNHPGRVRIVVSDTSGNDQKGLVWGLRSRHYDSSATAALTYQAEQMTTLNGAAGSAIAGASGGSAVVHNTLPANAWVPLLHTDLLAGSASLTHHGSYRVWARVSGSAIPALRLAWGAGSLANPVTNDAATIPGAGFYQLDLGAVRLAPSPTGTHEWNGVISAKATADNKQVVLDALMFQPLDEYAGKAASSDQPPPAAITTGAMCGTAVANDASSGTVAWSNPTNAMTRNASYAIWSVTNATATSQYLKATGGFSVPAGATIRGLRTTVIWAFGASGGKVMGDGGLSAYLVKAGTVLSNRPASETSVSIGGGLFQLVDGGSSDLWGTTWSVSDINNSGFGMAIQGVGTGWSGTTFTEYVDYVSTEVWYTLGSGFNIAYDAVVYSGGTAELRTEGLIRDAGGGVYGPVAQAIGDLPRIPSSGLESRPVELLIKPSRGDFGSLADAGLDSLSAVVKYRPSYLFTT